MLSGSQITEFETKSDIVEESSSELSATVAQGSETFSEVNSKPAVPQSRETKTESSAAEIKPSVVEANNNPQTSVIEGNGSTPVKNATAADTREVADKVIFYLNKARAEIGSGELAKPSGLTRYAEYRSGQLISNFAHATRILRCAGKIETRTVNIWLCRYDYQN